MSSGDPHPADNDKAKEHPHVHVWVPVLNEWKEVVGYLCECGVSRPA